MNEQNQNPKNRQVPPPAKPEPGLFDTIGSFPVWLLKIIAALTPDSLLRKTPPEKKKTRI